MIISYLKQNKRVWLYTVCEEDMAKKLFHDAIDNMYLIPCLEWSDMPRMYSEVDIILEVIEDNRMGSMDYCSKVVAGLVKTPFCIYNLKERNYKLYQDTAKAFEQERERLAINSGARFSDYYMPR